MKTILVTGANGFVGTHTLNALSAFEGVNVIAACRDRRKLIKTFRGEVREGDIRDTTYLQSLFEGVDVVVNAMAWSSLWGHSKDSAELFLQPNIKLIDEYLKSQASLYVNISSTSVTAPHTQAPPADAMSEGHAPHFWPHLVNVVNIENYLRGHASQAKSVINMRLGLFAGEHYSLGLLPILIPRMKTHLVPWVNAGQTGMPIIDGRDIGQAMALAATNDNLSAYQSFNVVGPEVPKVRDVVKFIASEYKLPEPHFSVPFTMAYPFAWLMEKLDPVSPWEPLIVRSIIHLLEECGATNERVSAVLGYQPEYSWKESIVSQMNEMSNKQIKPMKMARPIA